MSTSLKKKAEEKLAELQQIFAQLTQQEVEAQNALEQIKNAKQQTIGKFQALQELLGQDAPPLEVPEEKDDE